MKKSIEKALVEFLSDVRTTGEERKKGIPLISFVYREGDRAALIKALPLPMADRMTQGKIPAGKELLYRVDYFREGKAKVSIGILPAVKEPAAFLTLLENAIKRGERRAGRQSLCNHLKLHNALCGLEALAEEELMFAGIAGKMGKEKAGKYEAAAERSGRLERKEGQNGQGGQDRYDKDDRYNSANTAYYGEVLTYAQTCRDILNACPLGMPLPPFPDRSEFMAEWYREKRE